MPLEQKKKVAYLFGAGATHAELVALNPDLAPEREGSFNSTRVLQGHRKIMS